MLWLIEFSDPEGAWDKFYQTCLNLGMFIDCMYIDGQKGGVNAAKIWIHLNFLTCLVFRVQLSKLPSVSIVR